MKAKTEQELLAKMIAETFVNMAVINRHYVATISELTGKSKEEIEKEISILVPKGKEDYLKVVERFTGLQSDLNL